MRFIKMAVTIDRHEGFGPFSRSQRCKLQSYGHLDPNVVEHSKSGGTFSHSIELAFEAYNIHRSFSTPCLPLTTLVGEELTCHPPRIEIVRGSGAPVHALVVEVAIALASGIKPIPIPSGLGGAYAFCNQNGTNIAVAKPVDEEPFAFNNPKGLGGQMLGQPGLKKSIRIGETGIRELAAYLLDHGGLAAVPPTALVKFSNAAFFVTSNAAASALPMPKVASLQRFVGHAFDAGELGPSFFSVASVHNIGILDIRIMNLDRHAGNMLVAEHDTNNASYGSTVADLVPIDHGFCLPEWLDDPYFEWLHWPQASIPFSDYELDYISKLDPFKDAEVLRTAIPLLGESAIRVLIVCTVLLKQAAAAGLCLAEIGQMMTRKFREGQELPSEMENICLKVKASIHTKNRTEQGSKCEGAQISFGDLNQVQWEAFLEVFGELLRSVFEDKKCNGKKLEHLGSY
ncbi:phosphatidylinositol 4-kinase gamma 1 [Vigna radiata var. radiata]|uniref:1-phosphatidylinositol 4-kinase n=1 Tax=Vigna radiata var. radiata TaxID=3916 RepID=A0A1S3TC12_VIGRR|nr:phosphatidylinositol 4-kinase gamma 1 [Vigna radiata var. radiata]XP_014491299.1 phosphatidylinositol 4-kinase gamma 1 [Vigna radiata var. radiata]XP_022633362.1 phosphatidylinositol 4-kinase gamma 1 [Vigna radiata var. radiata]XP_022633363.1 phosphatidylinositol 4-kinase gamma 1 [Vigna radiata var. radiata]